MPHGGQGRLSFEAVAPFLGWDDRLRPMRSHELPRTPTPPLASRRVRGVQPPMVPRVGQLIAENPGTISLGQGMVAYGPPAAARQALADTWDDPDVHRYGAVAGSAELRQVLAEKLRRENGIEAETGQILVTAGSNMAFFHAVLAIADPGDEIVLPAPFYFNHEMAIALAGCRAVPVPTDHRYQLDPAAIEAALGPRTRAVVTVSPNNPTGAVYPAETLAEVGALCRRRGIYHFCDEAYEYFTWDGARHTSPASDPESRDHTLSFFSLSKAYGFAGWRIGYAVVPPHLVAEWLKIQDTNLICPTQVSERVALAALAAGSQYCHRHLEALVPVRRALLDGLADLGPKVLRRSAAEGAMYIFFELDSPLGGFELVERLIREHGVAALPGETFGASGCTLRVSYGALDAATATVGTRRLFGGLRAILDP